MKFESEAIRGLKVQARGVEHEKSGIERVLPYLDSVKYIRAAGLDRGVSVTRQICVGAIGVDVEKMKCAVNGAVNDGWKVPDVVDFSG